MTPDEARAILTQEFIDTFQVEHPEADVFIEGAPNQPDLANQTRPFAYLSLNVPRMEQSGLNGQNPPKRYYGDIEVGLYVREGQGIRPFYLMCGTIENSLTLRTISAIILKEMVVLDRTPAIGWQGKLVTIPYYFDYLP